MCGFFGTISSRWKAAAGRALGGVARRGPDDQGAWEEGDAWLGHRRLAVLDLSPAGRQPMAAAAGRFVLVYNGEVYNFPELRRELEGRGVRFRGTGDTEVLLEALAAWGAAVLPRLDGIFAFALWDRTDRRLLLARDRFGVKPLFYSTLDGPAFGSTLDPWWRLEGFPRRLDYEALRDYLASQSILSPHAILRDVRSLPPASSLTWDAAARAVRVERYWDIPRAISAPMRFDDLVAATDAALAESVRRQLVADVPLGAFLSGGIDSSLLVRYMTAGGSGAPKTFSVRFPQDGKYDESGYARLVARRFGCDHHEIDAQDLDAAALADAAASLDQPLADPAYLPTLALSRHTRERVTVAISGDGGDELFGGYERYLRDERAFPGGLLARVIPRAAVPARLTRGALSGKERVMWERVRLGPWPGSSKDMAALLTPEAARLADVGETMGLWRDRVMRWTGVLDTDALMRGDLWTYLSENCLVKTDRASMCYGLEVRVPLLGNPVADLVLPQPASVKLGLDGDGGSPVLKAVLRELARRHLPREAWDRPKHGFSVPLASYFAGAWRDRCAAWVERTRELAPFLNEAAVRRRWAAARHGKGDMRAMYTLVTLLGWLETHRVEA